MEVILQLGTIFAYGQTGTGKSYTMEGPKQATMDSEGIVPRSARHIFNSIKEQSGFNEYLVRVSYLEIYNEEIRDLLAKNSQKKLALKENIHQGGGGGGVYMPNLKQLVVKDLHELEKVLQIGRKNRSVGATKMNQESSRSHSILSIVVECQQGANLEQTSKRIHIGKLNLVDLAGSERQSKTESTGDRLKEGIKINLSLTALGNVISSLVDKRQTHVPYRDSKLTRLLQDSLGGNAKTVMIANIGPAEWNLEETMSTLRYAHRAKSIQNKPRINEDPKDAMLRQYQDEINRLKQLLKIKENEQKSENPLKDQDKIKEQEMVEEQNKSLAARAKYESVLQKQEEDLKQYSEKLEEEKSQQELLMKRIQEMESKILHGGVNLIEKVQELNKKSAQAKQELANKEKHAKAQNQKIDELLDLNEAVTEKYMAPNAFPFEFDSDECGASPRSLSPVSSMDLSQDSLVLDDNEDLPVEWLTGSITTPKSSLAEGDPNVSTFLSDYEGTNEMEIDNTTEGDHPSTQNLHQEIDGEKLDEMPEQVNKSGSDGLELMDQSSMENGSDQDNVDSNHNDSSINNSRKRTPPPVTSVSKSGKAQKEGSKSKPPINSHQTMNHSVDPTGNGLAPRSLSSLDTNAGDVTGYNPFRCEFDPPYDPGAEQMIADLEFLDDDTEEVTRAKLKLLDLYRWRVHQREKRTERLKKNEYGLLDVKKIQAMEKHHHSWLMNELCADLRAFARYKSLQKIETLAKGLFMERTLRNRIHELQEARSLGCRTFSDIRTRHKDSRIPKSAERTNAQLIGKWRRHGHPKNRTPDLVPELTDRERQFCVEASFSPWQYAVLRDRILREAEEHGGRFSKIHVKNFFRLECTQSIKLFDFLVSEGKFVNSDKDSTGIKKQLN
eukprot:g3975.t1